MKTNTNNQTSTTKLTFNEADQIVKSDLGGLRNYTHQLGEQFKQADNSTWIGTASRKQLLAEIIRLLANNHQGAIN